MTHVRITSLEWPDGCYEQKTRFLAAALNKPKEDESIHLIFELSGKGIERLAKTWRKNTWEYVISQTEVVDSLKTSFVKYWGMKGDGISSETINVKFVEAKAK